MLRFSVGVTRMDRARNEYIRAMARVEQFGGKVRGEVVDILDKGS